MMDDAKKHTAWSMENGTHDVLSLKPIATPEQKIELPRSKGVAFERCSEKRALEILSIAEANLRLCACRVPFQRHEDGVDSGEFVSLDFGTAWT